MEFLETVCVLAGVVLAARAFLRTRVLTANIRALDAKITILDQRLTALVSHPPAAAAEEPPTEAPPPTSSSPAEPVGPSGMGVAEPPAPGKNWEQVLVEYWLVWLGGLALALGGAFLVKVSIDYGLLTASVRVALDVVLGLALWAGAEFIVWGVPAEARPGNVSQALAAGGSATIFASLFAAYQLYGLLPAAAAFPLLALTAAGTVLMSLQHGQFVAVLGLAGAFAVPALVGSDEPLALPFFAYLTLVGAGSLTLLRYRHWWWLGWVTLAGSLGWTLLWLEHLYEHAQIWVVGGYLLAQLGLFAALRRGIPPLPFLQGVIEHPAACAVVRAALWAISFATLLLLQTDSYSNAALGCAFIIVLSLLTLAYRDSILDDVIGAVGLLTATLLALWSLPSPADQRIGLLHNLPPDQVSRFLAVAFAFALLFGAGGFCALTRVPRPSRWAALSAAAPPILLAVSYWRIAAYGLDIDWAIIALALAALQLAAAHWAAQRRDGATKNEIVLAAYAVGMLACTILAAVFVLENAWLTVALALHLPALGWVEGRQRLPVLRHVAFGIAATVLVRLTVNPQVLHYALSDTLIFNWLLYGYGVPAAAFMLATRQFGSRADDLLVKILEAGSIAFAVLLVTLELWHALSARPLRFVVDDFGLNAAETVAWLAIAGWLLHLGDRRDRAVLRWSGAIMFSVATGFAVGVQAITLNPLMPLLGAPVEGWLFLDSLLLAYAIPAALYGIIGYWRLGPHWLWRAALVLAAGFGFLWITLEVRHFFQGERLNLGVTGETEWYAYSAVWLAFAAGGLAAALRWRKPWLRRASLIGLGLVIGKVFLSDMADLSGALRALSFIGLGAALVGIGYAYRRFQPLQPGPQPGP